MIKLIAVPITIPTPKKAIGIVSGFSDPTEKPNAIGPNGNTITAHDTNINDVLGKSLFFDTKTSINSVNPRTNEKIITSTRTLKLTQLRCNNKTARKIIGTVINDQNITQIPLRNNIALLYYTKDIQDY